MGKKYKNPISKPGTVTVPIWEYRVLVEKAAALDLAHGLLTSNASYVVSDVIQAAYAETEGE